MFGEKLIIGNTFGKIDEKGRIKLPPFANAEENDEIILEKLTEDNVITLKLHIYQKYFDIIKRFQNLRDNATSSEDFLKYDMEIEKICSLLKHRISIDKQRRLQLPKHFFETSSWNNGDEIEFVGLGSSLLIRKQNK